jgi:hypothetical protein
MRCRAYLFNRYALLFCGDKLWFIGVFSKISPIGRSRTPPLKTFNAINLLRKEKEM